MSNVTVQPGAIDDRTRTLLVDTSRLYHERIGEVRAALSGQRQEQTAAESTFAAMAVLAVSFALEAGYTCEDIRAAARFLRVQSTGEAEATAAAL